MFDYKVSFVCQNMKASVVYCEFNLKLTFLICCNLQDVEAEEVVVDEEEEVRFIEWMIIYNIYDDAQHLPQFILLH